MKRANGETMKGRKYIVNHLPPEHVELVVPEEAYEDNGRPVAELVSRGPVLNGMGYVQVRRRMCQDTVSASIKYKRVFTRRPPRKPLRRNRV